MRFDARVMIRVRVLYDYGPFPLLALKKGKR